jgi:hypothetical protein
LEFEDIREILSQDSLTLLNEDRLFELICSGFQKSVSYFGLLEFVRFDYLSPETIHRFTDLSFDIFDSLTLPVWLRICECLSASVYPRFARKQIFTKRSDSARPLEGIIAFLTDQCGGNVHDRGVVNITSLSCARHDQHPKNAADFKGHSLFVSDGKPNEWLCYSFPWGLVYLTGYALRSQYIVGGRCNLKTWVIETSMDGDSWEIVDRRTDNYELDRRDVTVWFDIEPNFHRECRFVRLRQTGKSHYNNDSVYLQSFELFGDLLVANDPSTPVPFAIKVEK